jgi:hypothetical protein
MILAIASNTWRECSRRPFAYVAVITIVAIALVCTVLGVFSFGAGVQEARNLAVSTVLLAALVAAAFLGTSLVRADLERGTFLLAMSQPVALGAYVGGRFAGLLAVTAATCGLAAGGAAGVLALVGAGREGPFLDATLLAAWARVLLVVPVLSAAALAFSAVAGRLFAPVLLLAFFLAGDVAGATVLGRVLPAFGLFGLDADSAPPTGWLALYATLHSVVFLGITYLRLTLRAPIRTES